MIRRLLILLTLAACSLAADAFNILQCPYCTIEAPDGMTYDKALSAKTGLEVFRSRDKELIFAIGAEKVLPGMTAQSVAEAFRDNSGGGTVSQIGKKGAADIFMVRGVPGRRTLAVANTAGGQWLPVAMIVGSISPEQALRYLSTLRPKMY